MSIQIQLLHVLPNANQRGNRSAWRVLQRRCRLDSDCRCATIRSDRKCRRPDNLPQPPDVSVRCRRRRRFWRVGRVRKSLSNSAGQMICRICCFPKLFRAKIDFIRRGCNNRRSNRFLPKVYRPVHRIFPRARVLSPNRLPDLRSQNFRPFSMIFSASRLCFSSVKIGNSKFSVRHFDV